MHRHRFLTYSQTVDVRMPASHGDGRNMQQRRVCQTVDSYPCMYRSRREFYTAVGCLNRTSDAWRKRFRLWLQVELGQVCRGRDEGG